MVLKERKTFIKGGLGIIKNRILLINPPYNRFKGKDLPVFPLNLGYLASFLEKHGQIVHIYNADLMKSEEHKRFQVKWKGWRSDMELHSMFVKNFNNGYGYIWDEVKHILEDYAPQIIGISAVTANLRPALQIAKITKEILPKVPIVFGGPHATALPESILTDRNVDYLARGEGELTFLELINNDNLAEVGGLSYMNKGKIIHNAPRKYIKELDLLPFPSRHLLINSANYNKDKLDSLYNQILISRGCPYHCNFCASNILWGGYQWRTRSVISVIDEIKFLIKSYGVNDFTFWSDTFTANKKWVQEFCEEIKPLKVNWNCSTRIDRTNEDLMTLMKLAGCTSVSLGIESGSDRVLKEIGKKITVKDVETAIKILDKVGISWHTYFMIGLPTETVSDIWKTFYFIKKLKPGSHKIAVAVPYPGTDLYKELKASNSIPANVDWNMFDGRSDSISSLCLKNIEMNQFIKMRNRIFAYIDSYNKKKRLQTILYRMIGQLFENPLAFSNRIYKRILRILK